MHISDGSARENGRDFILLFRSFRLSYFIVYYCFGFLTSRLFAGNAVGIFMDPTRLLAKRGTRKAMKMKRKKINKERKGQIAKAKRKGKEKEIGAKTRGTKRAKNTYLKQPQYTGERNKLGSRGGSHGTPRLLQKGSFTCRRS